MYRWCRGYVGNEKDLKEREELYVHSEMFELTPNRCALLFVIRNRKLNATGNHRQYTYKIVGSMKQYRPASHEVHIWLRSSFTRLHTLLLALVVYSDRNAFGYCVHFRVHGCFTNEWQETDGRKETIRCCAIAPRLCRRSTGNCAHLCSGLLHAGNLVVLRQQRTMQS